MTEFRNGHEFDVKKLEAYMANTVQGLVTPIVVKQFKLGMHTSFTAKLQG